MEVYIIEYDNLEPYEDGYNWIGEVFKTKENAITYLNDNGYVNDNSLMNDKEWYTKEIDEFMAEGARIIYRQLEEDKLKEVT